MTLKEQFQKIAEHAHEFETIDSVEMAKSNLLILWKQLGENSEEYGLAKIAYAKLLVHGNKLKALVPKQKLPVEGVAEAQVALDMAMKDGMLAVTVGAIEPVVKMGHATSLEECLATIFAVQRQMIMAKYEGSLSGSGLVAFALLLDQKIKTKIETRLKGSKGEVYIKAYNDAVAKHGGLPHSSTEVLKQVEQAIGIPLKKKAKKKKDPDPPEKSTWFGVEEAMVTMPTDKFMPALAGQPVMQISTGVAKMMAAYMDEERKRWTEQGVECSDLLLRHNYLVILLDNYPVGEEIALELVPEKGVRIKRKEEVFEYQAITTNVSALISDLQK